MSEVEAEPRPSFTRLDIGVIIVLISMAFAGLIGVIAVLDSDSDIGAFGTGFGVAFVIFLAGGTVACALACLARGRLEALSLAALVAAGVAVDLLVLAILFGIDSEAYGKLVGVAFVGALFGLLILGLSLACQPHDPLGRWLYLAAVGASLLGAVLSVVLIITSGGDDLVPAAGPVPVDIANESLLRPLAVVLVVLAALWFAALAASRVERPGEPD